MKNATVSPIAACIAAATMAFFGQLTTSVNALIHAQTTTVVAASTNAALLMGSPNFLNAFAETVSVWMKSQVAARSKTLVRSATWTIMPFANEGPPWWIQSANAKKDLK